MLRAISRDPEKLKEMKEVMDRLVVEEDGKEPIVPEDFKTLWSVFEETSRLK